MSKRHLTAIARNRVSLPVKHLKKDGKLCGRILDYGCGRGHDALKCGMEKYDPFYSPDMPEGTFDTIVCNFVLNVIESESERVAVIRDIASRLNPDGKAYFSVRTDKPRLRGYTSRGTWQGFVMMDLPVVRSQTGFTTYVYCAGDPIPTHSVSINH